MGKIHMNIQQDIKNTLYLIIKIQTKTIICDIISLNTLANILKFNAKLVRLWENGPSLYCAGEKWYNGIILTESNLVTSNKFCTYIHTLTLQVSNTTSRYLSNRYFYIHRKNVLTKLLITTLFVIAKFLTSNRKGLK